MICANCENETPDTPCTECGDDPLLVGKYRLQRVLGRGGQGTTFLATGPDGAVAIKELHLGRAGAGKRAELIHREAAVLEQISHSQIPRLHEHFVNGVGVARSLYLVQDHIQGQNLEERLKTQRFTEVEVSDIVQQTGVILQSLHALSPPVIHRDIKPSNLLLDDNGHVHLIDFGSVRDVMRDTVGGGSTVAGTFGYMPPEQLVGDATPASDVYALGMAAIRLLTREQPATLADRTGRLTWRTQANVSDAMAQQINAMVDREPMNRSTAQQVAEGHLPGAPAAPPKAREASSRVPNAPPPAVPSTFPRTSAFGADSPKTVLKQPVTQRGTDIIEYTVPSVFTLPDVQRLAHMAAKHRLLPNNIVARPVPGHGGTLFHLTARPDGLPVGSSPWMTVSTAGDQTTIRLQPRSERARAVVMMALFAALGVAGMLIPVLQVDLFTSTNVGLWKALAVVGGALGGAGVVGSALMPGARRSRAAGRLREDIVQHWARSSDYRPLPPEPIQTTPTERNSADMAAHTKR